MDNYNKGILFEHRFWLQILGDHTRFIINALPCTEVSLVKKTEYFKCLFDKLLNIARNDLQERNLNQLTKSAYNATQELKSFKLYLLSKKIAGKITFNMSPTFLNHMLNELEEYLHVLNCYFNNRTFLTGPIHYHLLWLPDGSGHASSISASLDMTEKKLIKYSKKFAKTFDNLYLQAIEFKGYMRTGLCKFPALDALNKNSNSEMNCFKEFLENLKLGVLEKKVLGTLAPLVLDHMYREECYYQIKLSQSSTVKCPECDPTKPRIE